MNLIVPWDESEIEIVDRKYLHYKGQPISDTNQPPPHPVNVDAKTADEFRYKVYTLGLRGAMKGLIFPNVDYIDEFPDLAFTYGLDYGFTVDPTSLVRYAQSGKNIYLELLSYTPMDSPITIDEYFKKIQVRRSSIITADSSDRYTHAEKGAIRMTKDLKSKGWANLTPVRKTKTVMYWLLKMKDYNIHIVNSSNRTLYEAARKEQENYKMKEVNGIEINQPNDSYNHFWDAARYAFMAYNKKKSVVYGV